MKVLIGGGGIGGLTAAVALHQRGFDVQVYEQAAVLREVGAGVQIASNAVRVLHGLGLAEPLARIAVVPTSTDSRDWHSGEVLGRVPLGDEAVRRYGMPYYHVHRADLHDVLRAALPPERLILDSRVTGIEDGGDSITLRFADGRSATGDLLIGADGVHSVIREYVAGPDEAQWSHQIAWRGLVPVERVRHLHMPVASHSFWGPGRQFVTYYVSAGRLINWVGNMKTDADWGVESWSARGDKTECLREYDGWFSWVRELIVATDEVYKWALFDRPPLQQWTRGRVTLLGDAAHPMLPYLAQGAAQSIEDAHVLAASLDQFREHPLSGLEAYANRRRDRAAAVQAGAREAGRQMHLAGPAEVTARNERMRTDPAWHIARYDWLYGYDVGTAMN